DGRPSDDTLRKVAASLWGKIGDLSPQLDALIARFRQQLASGPIAAVVSRGLYKSPENLGLQNFKSSDWPTGPIEFTVQRERSFAIRESDKILSGSIDRLVIIKSRGKIIAADVLDFKTDEF